MQMKKQQANNEAMEAIRNQPTPKKGSRPVISKLRLFITCCLRKPVNVLVNHQGPDRR